MFKLRRSGTSYEQKNPFFRESCTHKWPNNKFLKNGARKERFSQFCANTNKISILRVTLASIPFSLENFTKFLRKVYLKLFKNP